jgi:hypothetical protein
MDKSGKTVPEGTSMKHIHGTSCCTSFDLINGIINENPKNKFLQDCLSYAFSSGASDRGFIFCGSNIRMGKSIHHNLQLRTVINTELHDTSNDATNSIV